MASSIRPVAFELDGAGMFSGLGAGILAADIGIITTISMEADTRRPYRNSFKQICPVGSLLIGEAVMIKGFLIAALSLLFLSACDQYASNGRYTDAIIVMVKQMRHSFGV